MRSSTGIIDINVDTIDVCSMLGVGLVSVGLGWAGFGGAGMGGMERN